MTPPGSPESLRVRAPGARDQEALAALWHELEGLHGRIAGGFFRTPARAGEPVPGVLAREALAAIASAGDRDTMLLLAEQRGEVLGAVHGFLRDTPAEPSFAPRRRLHVESLVVSPSARRRGVGRCLMTAAERWGRARRAEQVVLMVWSGNPEASGFYRALGYEPVSQVLAREL